MGKTVFVPIQFGIFMLYQFYKLHYIIIVVIIFSSLYFIHVFPFSKVDIIKLGQNLLALVCNIHIYMLENECIIPRSSALMLKFLESFIISYDIIYFLLSFNLPKQFMS